jgi:hypothetical protein
MSAMTAASNCCCWSGGKGRASGPAADDADGAQEFHPVGVGVGFGGGPADQRRDGVVGEQVAVDLLADHVRALGPQHRARAAHAGLELIVAGFDGLITNDKLCCTRRVRLSLSWWRKPLSQRGPVFQAGPVRAEEPYDPDMDCLPPVRSEPRCTAPVGSGVPVTGAPGSRARGRGLAGGAGHSGGA